MFKDITFNKDDKDYKMFTEKYKESYQKLCKMNKKIFKLINFFI